MKYIIFFILLVLFHELGHYLLAKKQGIYKGKKFYWWGGVSITIKKRFRNRFDYLSGIAFSFLTIPYWILIIQHPLWEFFLVAFVLGIADFIPVIYWKRILAKEKRKVGEVVT